jgi:magnesium transporter
MADVFIYNRGLKRGGLKDLRKKAKLIWVDISNPSVNDLEVLRKRFKLHKLTIEDCFKEKSRIKAEEFMTYDFLVLRGIKHVKKRLKVYDLNFIIGKNYIISVHKGPVESFEKLKEKTEKLNDLVKKGPDFLLHNLIDTEVDNIFPVIEKIDEKVDKIEDKLFKVYDPGNINKLFTLKRQILAIRRHMSGQRDIVGMLAKRNFPFISAKAEAYFRDIYDHMIRINEMIENTREVLSNALEINLTITSNRLNEIMKVLTVIATIMMPLTLITGIYGMNFKNMPELFWDYGYFFTLGLMIVIGLVMLFYFYKKGWLKG